MTRCVMAVRTLQHSAGMLCFSRRGLLAWRWGLLGMGGLLLAWLLL